MFVGDGGNVGRSWSMIRRSDGAICRRLEYKARATRLHEQASLASVSDIIA